MVYSSAKPNFCQKCGVSTSSSVKEEPTESVAEDSSESKAVIPNIDRLDIEIISNEKRGVTFGEMYEQKPMGKASTDDMVLSPQPAKSKKEFLEDFKREAGTSRRQ